ncbi:MAG: hypothetical protein N2745_00940 [Syntrophorhabdaceae bacterium]|nr:hypothetical protein [Syntrophorhabdaceae bacterium]
MILIIISSLMIASCSIWPFSSKKETPSDRKVATKKDVKTEGMEKVEDTAPKPGDIKVIDGVEYIYTSNRRYLLTPYEPEYIWVRKDQYNPRLGENLLTGGAARREREEVERRISRLEEDLKKKGLSQQMVYPYQIASLPQGAGMVPVQSIPTFTFNYPSPKMKRKVIVLPLEDLTNYKNEGLGELATKRLISRLEGTGAIICIDPNTISDKSISTERNALKSISELYGIQAVLKGSISDVFTSSSKIEGKDEKETSFAMSKISIDIFSTDTGTILKQLSGRNPISLTREKGEMSTEKAKIRAIDLAIEMIADDLLKAVLTIDWHARVASIEEGKVYINAGRLSGLDKGNLLDVYEPGEEIIDTKTKMPLGRTKGKYKGELEIAELFGIDASLAKIRKGSDFSPTDLVYFKK